MRQLQTAIKNRYQGDLSKRLQKLKPAVIFYKQKVRGEVNCETVNEMSSWRDLLEMFTAFCFFIVS